MAGWGDDAWGDFEWIELTSNVALGVNAPHAVAFETALGVNVAWCRCYSQTQAWNAGTTGWAEAIAADARGQNVILSFKSSFTWAQVASGSDDTRLTAIANGVMSNIDLPGIIVFNHEPENDGGTAADFKAASAHVRAVMAPLMTGWRFGVCLILDTFRTGSGRHPDDWVHTSNDVLLVDGYNWRDADTFGGGWADPAVSDRTVASIFGTNINAPTYAASKAMDFGFGEIGCSREEADTTGVERTAWWNLFADYVGALPAGTVEMICHFEKDTSAYTPGDGGVVNWAIRNEPASAAAFARLTGTVTTLPAGTTTYSSETTVAEGDTLRFPPNSSCTVIMDNKNLVIYGTLEMRPSSASVIHTVRFINVDEQAFVGAPVPSYAGPNMGSMTPSATDIGLWVLDQGILDAVGTTKVGWNRTGDSSTWVSTDEMKTTPWAAGDYTTFATHTKGAALQTVVGGNSVTYTQEAFNLTRNVRFEGTFGHHAHVIIMTPGVAQVIKYASFQFMGPRKNLAGGETSKIRGRWAGIHLHHLQDGTGTLIEGVVVKDGGAHAFVSHHSNNTVFRDCIAYHTQNDQYWWDNELVLIPGSSGDSNSSFGLAADQGSFNVLYDHCMAAWTFVQPGEEASSLSGFNLLFFDGSTITDCVAVGNVGTSTSAGFTWSESAGAVWANSNNIAHNNLARGVYIWHNNDNAHDVGFMTTFRNGGPGITNGAYTNNYHHHDEVSFGNSNYGFLGHAAPSSHTGANLTQVVQDGWYDIASVAYHVTSSSDHNVAVWRNNHLARLDINEFRSGPSFRHAHFDFVENDLQEPEQFCTQTHPHAGNHTVIYIYNGRPGVPSRDQLPSIFRIQRTDGTAWQMAQVGTSTSQFTANVIAPFAFSVPPQSLTQAVQNTAYSATLVRAFGEGTVTWALATAHGTSVASGPLPTGLTLSTAGVISGTPTQAGAFPIIVQATDATTQHARRALTLTVSSTVSLQITTSSLPNGAVGSSYSQTLAATGGSGSGRVWTLASGTLPAGLGLSSGGVISGTPTTVANYSFTVRVTDSASNTTTRLLSISVQNLNPSIDSTSLLVGQVSVAYSNTLVASGGTGSYTWSIVSGTLPTGLSLASSTGIISGTPTTATVNPITFRVTDTAARTNDKALTLTVTAGLGFVAAVPPPGRLGVFYQYLFTASGGTSPYSFTVGQELLLPPGVTMDDSGLLSGTPTASGTFVFSVDVFDSASHTANIPVSLPITQAFIPSKRTVAMRGASRYVSVQ